MSSFQEPQRHLYKVESVDKWAHDEGTVRVLSVVSVASSRANATVSSVINFAHTLSCDSVGTDMFLMEPAGVDAVVRYLRDTFPEEAALVDEVLSTIPESRNEQPAEVDYADSLLSDMDGMRKERWLQTEQIRLQRYELRLKDYEIELKDVELGRRQFTPRSHDNMDPKAFCTF